MPPSKARSVATNSASGALGSRSTSAQGPTWRWMIVSFGSPACEAFVSVHHAEWLSMARPRALASLSPSEAAAKNERRLRPDVVCENEYS